MKSNNTVLQASSVEFNRQSKFNLIMNFFKMTSVLVRFFPVLLSEEVKAEDFALVDFALSLAEKTTPEEYIW
jgi:hypothetical protein